MKLVAEVLLLIYILGALLSLFRICVFMSKRKRDEGDSVLVDVLSRILVISEITIFWPFYIK